MTTKEIILKVKELCEGKIEVKSIDFKQSFYFEQNANSLEIVLLYTEKGQTKKISNHVYSGSNMNYSIGSLLQEFEYDLEKLLSEKK